MVRVLPTGAGLLLLLVTASMLHAQSVWPERQELGRTPSVLAFSASESALLFSTSGSVFSSSSAEPRTDDPFDAWAEEVMNLSTWSHLRSPPQAAERGVAVPTALSAVLPGAGQHLLGQRRKWVYLALEVVGWVAYANRRSEGNRFRDRYRDFAWDQARLQLGPRIDPGFDYYETLTNWDRSGVYDSDSRAPEIQPETDPTTFNGAIWGLAAQLFLEGNTAAPPSTPEYDRAIQYYATRAYGTEFLWDWSGTGAAQDEFAGLIVSSDDRFRQATNVLGGIIANHVVSAVDAFVSARSNARVGAGLVPEASRFGTKWSAAVIVRTGR